ncbi:MAG: hypothetical protein JXA45_03160 [Methanomassiliicoccales archaeon]|nr:hypothetical protein [Methanomassiliicoccales archaeon]
MTGDRIEVDKDGREAFFVEIDDICHMLIPPPRNAFSTRSYVYMGQSVVDRLLYHFRQERGLERRKHTLVLLMPPEKITPGLSHKCEAAMDRFTSTKIKDNLNQMAAIRRRGLLMLPYALLFLVSFVGLGVLFGSNVITEIPPVWASVLSEGFFIIGWVAMWGPVDNLLFGRFPLRVENRTLRALAKTSIEIRPRRD